MGIKNSNSIGGNVESGATVIQENTVHKEKIINNIKNNIKNKPSIKIGATIVIFVGIICVAMMMFGGSKGIVGTWQNLEDETKLMIFSKDGNIELREEGKNSDFYKYEFDEELQSLILYNEYGIPDVTYQAILDGNSLTIINGKYEVEYKRK